MAAGEGIFIRTNLLEKNLSLKVDYIRQWLRMMYDQVQPYSKEA